MHNNIFKVRTVGVFLFNADAIPATAVASSTLTEIPDPISVDNITKTIINSQDTEEPRKNLITQREHFIVDSDSDDKIPLAGLLSGNAKKNSCNTSPFQKRLPTVTRKVKRTYPCF